MKTNKLLIQVIDKFKSTLHPRTEVLMKAKKKFLHMSDQELKRFFQLL